jgi:hypothetical protein
MTESKAERRERFAAEQADRLARQSGTAVARSPKRPGWTTTACWYEDADLLTGVVGDHEGKGAGLALAHGLYLAGHRRLSLVLPKGQEWPTVFRAPWLTAKVSVYTHEAGKVVPVTLPTRQQTMAKAGGLERTPDLHLGSTGEHVRALAEWASLHDELDAAHRGNVRSWACRGVRVLTLARGKDRVMVTAGVDAKTEAAHRHTITGPVSPQELAELQRHVTRGIADAKAGKYGPFEEHHLQSILRRRPDWLGLEHPVLREVPAFRPSTGDKPGRGFIDLAGLDGLGDVVLVETKLGGDDMLVLQGLDYWIWAAAQGNASWLRRRLHADPRRSRTQLLYAVGGRGDTRPRINKYAKAQFDALHPDVNWRLALLENWKSGAPQVSLLDPRTRP